MPQKLSITEQQAQTMIRQDKSIKLMNEQKNKILGCFQGRIVRENF